jgi:Na+-transporting NADH:ubiquinone oxidoreductase subunit NqrA
LATYVCPSKYDYCSILMDNLNKVYEELWNFLEIQ